MSSAAAAYEDKDETVGEYCDFLFDNVTCWPITEAGHLAVVACPTHFQGLPLTSGELSRNLSLK